MNSPLSGVSKRFRHFAAVDWSGAVGERQRGIAVACCAMGDDAPHIIRPGHVWSRADGHREAKLAAQAVQDALDGAELDVTGQALIGIRHLATDFTRESDGETIRAVLRFRAVMEPQ